MIGRILLSAGRALLSIVLIVAFTFFVMRASGDPALLILGPSAPPEAMAAFRAQWGLDQPLWTQFIRYFLGLLSGNFGLSMLDGRPAMTVVLERLPATLALTVPTLILKVLIGLPAGIYAALRRGKALDRLVIVGAVIGFAMPSFVIGLLLVMIFAVGLHWLPSGGSDTWQHAILPIASMTIGGLALLARFARSAMLEVLGRPFIRVALSKGLSLRNVLFGHALPNAILPTLTMIGLLIGQLPAGAVVVENVFAWPGIGRLLVSSVASRDLAVVQCILFIISVTMVIANFGIDLTVGLIDPRIRRQMSEER